jgi:uncharacterized SAM-dependent methyltransferase
MSKIKWKKQEEIELEKQKQMEKQQLKERFKGRKIGNLSQKECNELLEQIAADLGYL